MCDNNEHCQCDGDCHEEKEYKLEQLALQHHDVLIPKGQWPYNAAENLIQDLRERNVDVIIIGLPDGTDLEHMRIEDLRTLLQECERRIADKEPNGTED